MIHELRAHACILAKEIIQKHRNPISFKQNTQQVTCTRNSNEEERGPPPPYSEIDLEKA